LAGIVVYLHGAAKQTVGTVSASASRCKGLVSTDQAHQAPNTPNLNFCASYLRLRVDASSDFEDFTRSAGRRNSVIRLVFYLNVLYLTQENVLIEERPP
jgi:hypothetical protein